MINEKQPLLLGAHISIAGGFEQAIYQGESIGCTAIQIFTKSNRQWAAKPLEKSQIDIFKHTWKNSSIQSVIAHASYLINIGSPNQETRTKSTISLKNEIERCQQLSVPFLVLHPGSRGNSSEQECLKHITQQLDVIFQSTPGNTKVLLETMAGQGSNICYKLEQVASILNRSKHQSRLGVCVDTCHVFAAGYDIRTEETYKSFWDQFDAIIGIEKLKTIHLNDSKKELNSRADRHEDITKGKIGNKSFQLLINDARFFNIPKILETPKENLADDARNMKAIINLLSPKNKEVFLP